MNANIELIDGAIVISYEGLSFEETVMLDQLVEANGAGLLSLGHNEVSCEFILRSRTCECFPHGPEEPCTCEGCGFCTGHVVGCTCDINWDCPHKES